MPHNEIDRRQWFKQAAAAGAAVGAVGTSSSALAQAAASSGAMPRRALGATGETIPIIATGAFAKVDPTYDTLLHRSFKEGCNYFDAAEAYGNGMYHKAMGNFIEQVGRENIWLTSKSGMFKGKDAMPPQQYHDVIEKEFDSLKTDYLDMYFFHGVRHVEVLDPEYLKMVDDFKKRGRTRYFGFSCHDGNVVDLMNKAAALGSDAVQCIMFRYSFAKYGDLELNKAIDACVNAGIGLIAMKTQMSVPTDHEEVQKFHTDSGFSLQQAKLKAVWADERIASVCSMMSNTEQFDQNVSAAKTETQLTMRDVQRLREYTFRTASLRCTGCNEICESRVDGDLKIADTLRYLMYDECYGDAEQARNLYRQLTPAEKAFAATGLAEATAACPQGIDIRARLERAQQRLA